MKDLIVWFRNSVIGKVFFIGLLVLIMQIPLEMIEERIAERGSRAAQAGREIANIWGGSQTIGGPVLVVPVEHEQTIDEGGINERTVRTWDDVYTLPASLGIRVDAGTQVLRRGIYEVPVYTATVEISGSLEPPALAEAGPGRRVFWEEALLSIPISDARSIREPVRITIGSASAEFAPAGERIDGLGRQLVVSLAELGIESIEDAVPFTITFRAGGTGSLRFLPFGDVTNVAVRSDWASPSFTGAFLPDERSVADTGFEASWRVLDLGRGYASSWRRSDGAHRALTEQLQATSFGVDFIVPVGVHEASLRATKYAVLFLTMTFLTYFLFELFLPLRLHAFQYLLVGCANTIFYLLLVALSEHIGFDVAYGVSASGSIALIGGYSAAVLGAARRAAPVVLMLISIYGYLYLTLQLEDFALLSGSLGLFAILAAVMYLTRRVDWDAVSFDSIKSNTAQ